MSTIRTSSRRAWLGLALLTTTLFMAALDMTVLFLAMPAIAADLQPGATQQLWVLHVGDVLGAGLVLTMGRLADRFGARRVLGAGVMAYGLASLLAALASSIGVLILARALLGAASVAFVPAGMILLRQLFGEGRAFATAVGVFMAAFSAGMALGPSLGGALLEAFDWHAIFLINVPIAALVLLALRILPRVEGRGTGRIDLVSALQSVVAVALLVHGVQELAARGPHPVEVGSVLAGLLVGRAFVRRQRRLEEPLLDLDLLRTPAVAFSLVAIVGVVVASVGAEMQLAQHLQTALGLSPRDAGLLLVVPAVFSIGGTVLAPHLLRRLTPAQVMGGGALLAAVGAVGMVVAATRGGPAAVVATTSIVELGVAPTFGLGAGLIAASAPAERVGSAMAAQDVGGGLGNTLGLTIGGTLAFVAYQASLGARLPSGLASGDVDAASDSVGGALARAGELSGRLGDELSVAAREAFGVATQSLYAMAAVVLLALGIAVLRGLRGVRLEA